MQKLSLTIIRIILCIGVVSSVLLVPLVSRAGTVICWGDPTQTNLCVSTGIVAIATGYQQSVLLKMDGTVANCGLHWDPPANINDPWSFPINVPSGLSNVVAVAGGYAHSLALKSDGTIVPWGRNTYGQTNVPGDLTDVVAISAADNHSLALKADGTVVSWGDPSRVPVPGGLSNVVAISAGTADLALLANGTVRGWGTSHTLTNALAGLSNIVAISSGWSMPLSWNEFLALNADGAVIGYPNLTNIVAIADSSGTDHHVSLAVRADGTVVGWGFNFYGGPFVPPGLSNVVAVSSDSTHSLALIGAGPPSPDAPWTNPVLDGNGFRLQVLTQSGRVYRLEYKNSLADSGWMTLPLVAGNGSLQTLSDPTATGDQRFYRIRRW